MTDVVRDFAAEREASRRQVEAEALRFYEQQHGRLPDAPDDPPARTELAPAEVLRFLGPNAAKLSAQLPATGPVTEVSYAELEQRKARHGAFWMSGGGRLPDDLQPPPASPPKSAERDRWIRESEEDGYTWA